MKTKNIFKFITAIAVCQLAGLIGAIFTTPKISGWYSEINKPTIAPPNWIFAPVWTTLFILMGIAFFLVWKKYPKNKGAKSAMIVFSLQLVLNVLWSFLFFGLQNPLYAFIEITILWLVILASIVAFYKVDKNAAYLLIPYILWVSFAGILNYFLVILNI